MRSCIGTVVVLLGVILGREALSLRLLAAGGFVILAVRPEALLGPSFQLTFAAVTGLVALFNSRFGRWLTTPRQDAGVAVAQRFNTHLAGLLVTGIIAEALLSATALFHFNATGAYGVLANLARDPMDELRHHAAARRRARARSDSALATSGVVAARPCHGRADPRSRSRSRRGRDRSSASG